MSKNLIKKSEIISVTQFRRLMLILRRAHVPKATSVKKQGLTGLSKFITLKQM